MKQPGKYALTGALAGLANGLFGSGGGLFLVPLFNGWAKLPQRKAFATSVAVILPLSLVSAAVVLVPGRAGCLRRLALSAGRGSGRPARWENLPPGTPGVGAPGLWAAAALRRRPGGAGPMSWLLSALVGAATGVLSGFGVGGGTLLLLWLTLVQGMGQFQAGGVNLLYFAACALPALWGHLRQGLVDRQAALWSAATGAPACVLAAFVASSLEVTLLRRLFGVFLLAVGLRSFFRKQKIPRRAARINPPKGRTLVTRPKPPQRREFHTKGVVTMSILDRIALALTVIGGINWGLVGIFRFDLVAWLFGGQDALISPHHLHGGGHSGPVVHQPSLPRPGQRAGGRNPRKGNAARVDGISLCTYSSKASSMLPMLVVTSRVLGPPVIWSARLELPMSVSTAIWYSSWRPAMVPVTSPESALKVMSGLAKASRSMLPSSPSRRPPRKPGWKPR